MPIQTNPHHQRRRWRGAVLAALGAALGMVLLASGHFPLFKINSGAGDLAVVLFFVLSLFLRGCAWKEHGQVMSALLWLACGMTSMWAFLHFFVQSGMQ